MKKSLKLALLSLFLLTAFLSCKKDKEVADPVTPVKPEEKLYEMVETDTIHLPLELIQGILSDINDIDVSVIPNGIETDAAVDSITANWDSGIIAEKTFSSFTAPLTTWFRT